MRSIFSRGLNSTRMLLPNEGLALSSSPCHRVRDCSECEDGTQHDGCVMSRTPGSVAQQVAHLVSMVPNGGGDKVCATTRDHD